MPVVNHAVPGLQERLRGVFELLHSRPELSFEEFETSARIRAALEEAGVEIRDAALPTGLVARVRGAEAGETVVLRADIDALPLEEETDLPYRSRIRGRMHACGHDFHAAALLGAALILQRKKSALPGSVLLVFQPAEEESGGARRVLDTGVLAGAREIYGLHGWPDLASGVVAVKEGAAYAAALRCEIEIRGTGGHAASPHLCRDPIVAAAALVGAAQTAVSRSASPFEQVVLSFTRIEGGSAWNVIPERARLDGTIRALGTECAARAAARLAEICRGIETAYGVRVAETVTLDTPAVENDAALCAFAREAAKEAGFTVAPGEATMGAEDFALYQREMPGVFLAFGVNSPAPWHNPRFRADPAGLADAAALLALLAEKALMRLAAGTRAKGGA